MTLRIVPATNSSFVFKTFPDDCWHVILKFSNEEDLLKITRVCQFLRFWGQNELHRYIFPDIQTLNLREITVLKLTEDQMKTFYRRISSEATSDINVIIRLKQEQLSIAFKLLNQMHKKCSQYVPSISNKIKNMPIENKISFLKKGIIYINEEKINIFEILRSRESILFFSFSFAFILLNIFTASLGHFLLLKTVPSSLPKSLKILFGSFSYSLATFIPFVCILIAFLYTMLHAYTFFISNDKKMNTDLLIPIFFGSITVILSVLQDLHFSLKSLSLISPCLKNLPLKYPTIFSHFLKFHILLILINCAAIIAVSYIFITQLMIPSLSPKELIEDYLNEQLNNFKKNTCINLKSIFFKKDYLYILHKIT